jgi:hypothetical protein
MSVSHEATTPPGCAKLCWRWATVIALQIGGGRATHGLLPL